MELNNKTMRRIIFIICFAVILIWLVFLPDSVNQVFSRIVGIFSPLIVGCITAFIINVPMRAIEARLFAKKPKLAKLRRPLAMVLALLFCLAVVAFVVMAVIPELVQTIYLVASSLPPYFGEAADKLISWANRVFQETPELLNAINAIDFNWAKIAQDAWGFLQTSVTSVFGSTVTIVIGLFGGISNFFIGLIFAIYLLFAKETLARQIRMLLYAWLSRRRADRVVYIASLTHKAFSSFISGQCLEACILGVMFALAMWIFRFPHVMLISVLIGFLALIPIFGAVIGCVIGAFLILVQNPMQAVWFVLMFLVIQQIEGNVIYPRVVGKSVGLPAIWVLIACTIGGTAFGLAGMIVMIPIFSVLYTLIGESAKQRLREKEISTEKL